MASFVKFEAFSEGLAEKGHNLDSDTLKVYLSNAAPNVATMANKADLAAWTKELARNTPDVRAAVRDKMWDWQIDSDLAGVRGKAALAELPEAEADAWQKLWDDVADVQARTQTKTNAKSNKK